jgi:hypothetical protein
MSAETYALFFGLRLLDSGPSQGVTHQGLTGMSHSLFNPTSRERLGHAPPGHIFRP